MERILKIIDDMESDVDNIDVESINHYYIVKYDGISNKVIISIVEAYQQYNMDTDIYDIVEVTDIVEVIPDINDNTFINMLIDYINGEHYNVYENILQFEGLSIF